MKTLYSLNQNRFTSIVRIASAVTLIAAAVVSGMMALSSSASGSSTPAAQPQVLDDSQMKALSTTVGGAAPLSTARTVAHWFGTTLNPNGVTYGYNMVGADPNDCGSACETTIPTDIIPLKVVVGDMTFDPMDSHNALAGTLASPQFAPNDYTSTPFATDSSFARGAGGALSSAGNQLQLQDATMRSQFNKTGSSSYHVRLGTPTVHDEITITVPPSKGTLLQSGRGVIFAAVDIQWWATRIQNLNSSLGYNDPTHLPIYLTDSVLLSGSFGCCVIGFHGAQNVPSNTLNGPQNGRGNQPVQTFAWASWIRPGIYARALPPQGTSLNWAIQDIHALSHEVAEWADDPFINNFVEPWLTPTAPQYGCTSLLETGDPVVGIGFAMGTNIYDQTPNPNGTISYDGFYHPEDEVFLPWFMRTAPNTVSEPTQSPSANIGRYTLMGDLNPFPGFRQPATGCN
jgi:hypothetical protein